jgi:hypothetical protein
MADAAAKEVARRGGTGGNNADPFDPRVNPLNIPDAPKASGPKKVLSVWMKPIERGAANGLQAIEKRQATIDNLYKGLMAGRFNPLFGEEPERITNGKMGALNALSDAKNPKIGLFASTNSEGKFTGFKSTKEGRNSIEISNLGTDGTQPGSGRAMFNQLIWLAASKGKGLDVSPVPDAVEFYRKMGMTGDMGSMEMSADAVKRRAIQLRREGQL